MDNTIKYEGKIRTTFKDDTIWITQKNMADLFGVQVSAINKHINNVFDDGELDRNSTISKMEIVQNEGGHSVSRDLEHYSLDVIISVGYRVNSQKATQFRIWANKVLKQYIKDGYVINEALLRKDPEKLNKLAAKIRELRANEKNIYASVRECFKLAASDYKPSSSEVRSFYALLQDKFHHAVTKMTSSKLILDRAYHTDENMGIVNFKGDVPTFQEAKTGKNYLREDELYRLHLLSEQFLLYAESTALMGQSKTMKELHQQLDNLLELNGYPVFDGYKDYLKEQADEHAKKEYEQYIEIKKLEHLGLDVDLQLFYSGAYDEYKEETSKIKISDLSSDSKPLIENNIESVFDKSLKQALDFNPKD